MSRPKLDSLAPAVVPLVPPSSLSSPRLQTGDYVVHLNHGVGLYRGMETITTPTVTPTGEVGEPVERDCLLLEYRDGDKLYVPADQVDRVRPFVSSAGAAVTQPTLDKLNGSQSWSKAVARARREAAEVAKEMLARYTARAGRRGQAFGPDSPEQQAMEAAFPYEETPDQLRAIGEVKRDLEAPRPMDRLLVGDVGYGKTEVAVRAAFKVASQGWQVAVLCPTSVLAAQHLHTFCDRLGDFGIHVALLSRFVSPEEQKATLAALAQGEVAVVIGTHRLLSEDVLWRNLGLVIVDEEQRFGVGHKETLKTLRETVDTLTMTATPIPRTLSLATAGLLDASVIADPPQGRAAIETILHAQDDPLIRQAVLREVERGGQVFYLHNQVESIEDTAAYLGELVPEVRIGVAHGQMAEDALETVMHDFYEQRLDVLVCTTIIETGLDVSNANTLIVEDADRLGLAQLYQLRGRVGRSDRQAYTLLLFRTDAGENSSETTLSPEAVARLTALREFTAPGAGHQIAERDLQLRGAGSLLGLEQSGASAAGAVGYDLFLQLLDQAVRSQRGQKPDPSTVPLPTVELPFLATAIPNSYVEDSHERLSLYNRIASVQSTKALNELRDEVAVRFGPIPASVENLFTLTRLRLRCRAAGVKSITAGAGFLTLELRRGITLSPAQGLALRQAIERLSGRVSTDEPEKIRIHAPVAEALPLMDEALKVLGEERQRARKRKMTEAKNVNLCHSPSKE